MIFNRFLEKEFIYKQFLILSTITNLVLATGQKQKYNGYQCYNRYTNVSFSNPELSIPYNINTGLTYNGINQMYNYNYHTQP